MLQVEELQERDEVREETVERRIPQVKAMYPYSGQGMEMEKSEVRSANHNTANLPSANQNTGHWLLFLAASA